MNDMKLSFKLFSVLPYLLYPFYELVRSSGNRPLRVTCLVVSLAVSPVTLPLFFLAVLVLMLIMAFEMA